MPYAVITGAGSGIGMAVAERLLHEGYSIAICGRNSEKLKTAEANWNERYPAASILAIPADLSDKVQANAFMTAVEAVFPEVHVLINNAGTFIPGAIITEPDGTLEQLIEVNLYSAYYTTRAALPLLRKATQAHIFNICSVASLKAYPNGGAYSISKYALNGFSENLREELRPLRIKVTTVFPGATWTPSWEGSGVLPERIMKAEDVAAAIFCAVGLSYQACTEQIVLRPIEGDL